MCRDVPWYLRTTRGGSIKGRDPRSNRIAGSDASIKGGIVKRTVFLVTVGIVVASMLVTSGLSVSSAQESTEQAAVCAP